MNQDPHAVRSRLNQIDVGNNFDNRNTQNSEIAIQRDYYKQTAKIYDQMHVNERDEHYFALRILESIIDYYEVKSILDIGAGTGRVALYLKQRNPQIKIVSIEPVSEFREIGYSKGLANEELIEGDVNKLQFDDGSFDLVSEFGVLHHVPKPKIAVSEMLRVGRKGIYISDSNNFGQGSFLSRTVKQTLNALKLWPVVDFIKTKGKGYMISEGDGLAYSYSVFNNYKQISKSCNIHIFNTQPSGINPYRTASHVSLLGIKKQLSNGDKLG